MPQSDDFARHEVLHMSFVLTQMIRDYLIEHEQIQRTPEWFDLAEESLDAMARLYRAIGAGHSGEDSQA